MIEAKLLLGLITVVAYGIYIKKDLKETIDEIVEAMAQ
jgi:hypothetical protein